MRLLNLTAKPNTPLNRPNFLGDVRLLIGTAKPNTPLLGNVRL